MSLFFIVLSLSFGISLALDLLVNSTLVARFAVIGSFVGLQKTLNPGIAFGIRLPPLVQEVFVLIALLAIGVTAVRTAKTAWQRIGFGLIVGGALANLTDRAMDGYVTDFIQVGSFYIFNVADSCITVGVAALLLESVILQYRKNDGNLPE